MPSSAAETLAAIERLLEKAAQPVLLEPGEREIPLLREHYSLQASGSAVQIHAWPDERRASNKSN